jgi:hypothetical protein
MTSTEVFAVHDDKQGWDVIPLGEKAPTTTRGLDP